MTRNIAILGAGAMGSIIARGLLRAGFSPEDITVADKFPESVSRLVEEAGVNGAETARSAVEQSNVVVIAVKPNNVGELLDEIAEVVTSDHLVVSIAAGVPIAVYERLLPGCPVVRAMPNTPAAVEEGVTAFATGTHATDEHAEMAQHMLSSIGLAVHVPEDLLDAVTAVSGSGPAYAFLLAEAMTAAGVELGLSADVAAILVNQTIKGAGTMLVSSEMDAAALRVQVTSPGGTTAAALGVFDSAEFHGLVQTALKAAADRSAELGADAANEQT